MQHLLSGQQPQGLGQGYHRLSILGTDYPHPKDRMKSVSRLMNSPSLGALNMLETRHRAIFHGRKIQETLTRRFPPSLTP